MKKIPLLKIEIRNQSEDEAVIDIDGEIGWVNENGDWNTGPKIKAKLKEISDLKAKKIIVNIASLGGFVDEGLQIHDILAQHEAEIETRVTSMTASAATIIAQAGDVRKISDNALYLVHRAWGFAFGNMNDMMAMAADLEVIDNRIANIYAKRSGKSLKEVVKLMNENDGGGKWIDPQEALDFGLVDEVFEPMRAAASVDADMFRAMGLPVPEGAKENTEGKTATVESGLPDEFKKEMEKLKELIEGVNNKFNHIKRENIITNFKNYG